LNVYEVAPQRPVRARAEVGISELLRRPLVRTELAVALAPRLRFLARYKRNTISDL